MMYRAQRQTQRPSGYKLRSASLLRLLPFSRDRLDLLEHAQEVATAFFAFRVSSYPRRTSSRVTLRDSLSSSNPKIPVMIKILADADVIDSAAFEYLTKAMSVRREGIDSSQAFEVWWASAAPVT
jgi:hypothetical protein